MSDHIVRNGGIEQVHEPAFRSTADHPGGRGGEEDRSSGRHQYALGRRGDGTPIVLIHGIPTGPALWRHVLPRISNVRVWGAADQFQKAEYGERFARDLSAPLRQIEQGRHSTPEDHPEIVAHEINQLLADVQQGSRKR
ncbi:alpha/beta fold hydrolase [Nitratireductor sp. GCM10026969]|uniref:alpha/beta fold hydrolase n=1 Tax=Nitratireductor sp. GCM10026969 TaxID=3252645 RepID=UPI00361C2805